MDGFFSFFGKLVVIVFVVGVLVGGGFYLGTGKLPFSFSNPAPAAVTTTAPTPTQMPIINASPTTASSSPTAPTGQTVSGGGLAGLSFYAYTIVVPPDWTVNKEETTGTQKITISKNAYMISIYQAATGGALCVYPGDTPAMMSTPFGAYTTLDDADGNEYRRAMPTGSTAGFTLCQKNHGAPGYGLPTTFGHITYTTPANPDPAILSQMDGIISTLKKQ